jgi:hypothetical protein
MTKHIGFVILSHNHPDQLLRLVRCLQNIYDNPPIAIHHDFSQSPVDANEFPSDIKFVRPHLRTRWGQFSIVSGALKALDLLYSNEAPQWFFLLSGVDYPVMNADKVLGELSTNGVDALIDYRQVPECRWDKHLDPPENSGLMHFSLPANSKLAHRRYLGLNLWVPIIRKGPRIGRLTFRFPIRDWRAPFCPDFKCYYGDQWFGGNSRVANILLNPTETHLRLRRHLRLRTIPDECYYQTILANAPGLRISRATRRFAEWMGGGYHPRAMELGDLPAIFQSKAYFARKFTPVSPVLDEIDVALSNVSLTPTTPMARAA